MSMKSTCMYCHFDTLAVQYTGVKDRLGYVPGERTFLQCKRCGSLTLDRVPDESELAAYYPEVYSFSTTFGGRSLLRRLTVWAEYHFFFNLIYKYQSSVVLSQYRVRSGEKPLLLDIGCGRGLRLLDFQRRGVRVHGVDIVEEVVRQLKTAHDLDADVGGVADLQKLYADSTFDIVTAFYLVEHVTSVTELLSQCWRILKPGGLFACAVPLADGTLCEAYGKDWIEIAEAPRHISLPSQQGIAICLQDCGFTNISIRPDSLLTTSGQLPLSIMPSIASTQVYASKRLLPLLRRGLGAMAMIVSMPYVWYVNTVRKRPAMAIICARKPN